MDCIVRAVFRADEVLRVERVVRPMSDVIFCKWIHVMYDQTVMNLVSRDSKIATFVSQDDGSASILPRTRRVEALIHPSVETEGRLADFTSQSEVFVSLDERSELTELAIRPKPRTHRTQAHLPPENFRCMPSSPPKRLGSKLRYASLIPLPRVWSQARQLRSSVAAVQVFPG